MYSQNDITLVFECTSYKKKENCKYYDRLKCIQNIQYGFKFLVQLPTKIRNLTLFMPQSVQNKQILTDLNCNKIYIYLLFTFLSTVYYKDKNNFTLLLFKFDITFALNSTK